MASSANQTISKHNSSLQLSHTQEPHNLHPQPHITNPPKTDTMLLQRSALAIARRVAVAPAVRRSLATSAVRRKFFVQSLSLPIRNTEKNRAELLVEISRIEWEDKLLKTPPCCYTGFNDICETDDDYTQARIME